MVFVSKESSVCYRVGGEVKHEKLVSNKLIRVKYLPSRHNKANVSSVSPSLQLLLNRKRTSMLVLDISFRTMIFEIQLCCLTSFLAIIRLI